MVAGGELSKLSQSNNPFHLKTTVTCLIWTINRIYNFHGQHDKCHIWGSNLMVFSVFVDSVVFVFSHSICIFFNLWLFIDPVVPTKYNWENNPTKEQITAASFCNKSMSRLPVAIHPFCPCQAYFPFLWHCNYSESATFVKQIYRVYCNLY